MRYLLSFLFLSGSLSTLLWPRQLTGEAVLPQHAVLGLALMCAAGLLLDAAALLPTLALLAGLAATFTTDTSMQAFHGLACLVFTGVSIAHLIHRQIG